MLIRANPCEFVSKNVTGRNAAESSSDVSVRHFWQGCSPTDDRHEYLFGRAHALVYLDFPYQQTSLPCGFYAVRITEELRSALFVNADGETVARADLEVMTGPNLPPAAGPHTGTSTSSHEVCIWIVLPTWLGGFVLFRACLKFAIEVSTTIP